MPRRLRMQSLQTELASLNALLQSAREMDDPVGEFQLEKRKNKIETELRGLAANPEKKASIALLFGGKPVLGSRGVSAEFAGQMLESFQDLVARKRASAELWTLGSRGRIPGKQATDLMVTSLTKGSFGFVLDELSDQEEIDTSALKLTVEEVVRTLEKFASPDELDFEEVAEQLDSRMLKSLNEFFVTLDSADGTVRFVDDGADISLDAPSVQRGRLRTEATSIDESDEAIEGVLVGLLPEHRKFEMLVTDKLVYGSVSKEAAEQYSQLVAGGGNPERQSWKVLMKRRIVTPLNRSPREVNTLLQFLGQTST